MTTCQRMRNRCWFVLLHFTSEAKMRSSLLLALCVAFACLLVGIEGHSYVTSPRPRNDQHGGCRIGGPPQYPVSKAKQSKEDKKIIENSLMSYAKRFLLSFFSLRRSY